MYPVVEGTQLNGQLVSEGALFIRNRVGCISINDVKRLPRERWAVTTVANIMQPCSAATAITPDADAMEVLSAMNRTQNSRYLVMEGDRLVGVLSLKGMLKFLSVKLDLEESENVDLRAAAPGAQKPSLGRGA